MKTKGLLIHNTIEDALKKANQGHRDALGYLVFTFVIRAEPPHPTCEQIVVSLVAQGWHLQGGPVVVREADEESSLAILTMFHYEPRPLRLEGGFEGRFRGEIEGRF